VFETRTLGSLVDDGHAASDRGALILPEEKLVEAADNRVVRDLLSRYQHVFVYPCGGSPAGIGALGALFECVVTARPAGANAGYSVATRFEAAGPFAGLDVSDVNTAHDSTLTFAGGPHAFEPMIGNGDGSLLARTVLGTTEVFILSSDSVFDTEAETVRNLRTRECFSSLVPLLFFLRHAGVPFWRAERPSASVIIDDVNLRRRYGFVDIATLARFVDERDCAISIAFIPWNWNRTSRDVAALFASRWPRLSLCVHGCDHIGAEFSTRSVDATLPMIASSLQRMGALAERSGVRYDRVMVFPQGRFSAPAMEALRQSEFVAAVNTEVADDTTRRGVPAAELLAPAITAYGGLPLFLRRKLHEPIADFALDLLLGKPCLLVTHHDDFKDGMQALASLVVTLSERQPGLRWTNPEAIATQTYATRPGPGSEVDVRLVSPATAITGQHGMLRFSKPEPLTGVPFEVSVGGRSVTSQRHGPDVVFASDAGESSVVTVAPAGQRTIAPAAHPLSYRSKVAARRYLSEFRDNYVAKSPWAKAAVRLVRPQAAGNRT
jgi:hypothetical protein